MEAKFQDLLKNIIPGFFILTGVLFVSYITDIRMILNFVKIMNDIPIEISVISLPFLLYIIGYINDIISSQIEYWLYEYIISRPSYSILNGKTTRYRLTNIDKVKIGLQIDLATTCFSKDDAYKYFQKANALKNPAPIIIEFYLSYIFARNMMIASSLIFLFSVLSLFAIQSSILVWLIGLFFLLTILFGHRWRQRAFYYTKRVFLTE